jgi:outer membrane protein assembly factor BamA
MEPTKAVRRAVVFFFIGFVAIFIFGLPTTGQSQEKVRLKEIKISGNLRVEDDGIRLHLKSRPGENFDPATVVLDV